MEETTVTWWRASRIWWAYCWRLVALAAILSVLGGVFAVGATEIVAQYGLPAQHAITGMVPIALALLALIVVAPIKLIVGKRYGRYRLVLVTEESRR